MGKCCLHASLFIFNQIIIKVAGIQDRHKGSVEFDFGRIRPLILELLALKWWKFHTFELEYLWSQLANLDEILCVASLGWGKGCIRFWIRLDQNSGFHGNRKPHWLIMGKMMSPPFLGCFFYLILFILAGNKDMHIVSDEFEFQPDWTTDYGVSCLEV